MNHNEPHLNRLETLACQNITAITPMDTESLLWACRELERLQAEAATIKGDAEAWNNSYHAMQKERDEYAKANAKLQAACRRITAAALSALETLTANPAIDPGNVRAKLVEALETNP